MKHYDRQGAMHAILKKLGVQYRRNKYGSQKIRCPLPDRHPRGDRNPSCSLLITAGRLHCFSCGWAGDAADLAEELWGWDFQRSAKELIDEDTGQRPADYSRDGGDTFLF